MKTLSVWARPCHATSASAFDTNALVCWMCWITAARLDRSCRLTVSASLSQRAVCCTNQTCVCLCYCMQTHCGFGALRQSCLLDVSCDALWTSFLWLTPWHSLITNNSESSSKNGQTFVLVDVCIITKQQNDTEVIKSLQSVVLLRYKTYYPIIITQSPSHSSKTPCSTSFLPTGT